MWAKDKRINIFKDYKNADSKKKTDLMLSNFDLIPKVICLEEKKIRYKLRIALEYQKSHSRDELGVRVQTSNLSDPTAADALFEAVLDEAFATGNIDRSLFKCKEIMEYESDIQIISSMRMDFGLLEDIIEGYSDDNKILLKMRLKDRKPYRLIAEKRDCSSDTIRRQIKRLYDEIREEMIECLEVNNFEES